MFFQFSPVRREPKQETTQKEDESEKVEVLSLAPFTPNPKLFFEDVQVGRTVNRKLLIENPTNHDVHLFVINHIPQELNITINPEQISIGKKSSAIIELRWEPLQEEFSRHMITIADGKRIHRDVPVAFKSVLPKKPKTGTRKKIKPQSTASKQKTSPNRLSPTRKYYSTKPPYVSPNRYSQKYSSPITKPAPKKVPVNIQMALPEIKSQNISPPNRNNKYRVKDKENMPLLNETSESNLFVSPSSATFRLDYLQPLERRETYVVNGKNNVSPTEPAFNDSLENVSPQLAPRIVVDGPIINTSIKRQPLGFSNQENLSPRITEYIQQRLENAPGNRNFEYKLMQMESFCFTPVSTPIKQAQDFSPRLSSTAEKIKPEDNIEKINITRFLFPENTTSELPPKSPNISTETYIKSNLSTETYAKGNISSDTYVKSNLSGGTFTKDTSVGDVTNLTFSPISSKIATSPIICQPNVELFSQFNSDNAKQVIEANLWSGIRNQPLCSIKEESYVHQSMQESVCDTTKSFLKRKSDLNFTFTPPKRPNIKRSPKEWSKSGGSAIRIAKKSTGLNLKKFLSNSKTNSEEEANVSAVLTKQDTHQVIIQNPYILAATNLADPFMTSHLYINEEWLDQQQVDFKKWLNALLTPPAELDSEEHLVDVAKVWQECKKREIDVAPTKELVSSRYLVNNKLNALRKSAQNLFRSKEISSVLSKVVLAVETGKLMIREDKDIHLNLALKSEVMSMFLSYNPLWLRIGLETIYNELIPLKSNSDVIGLSTFIANRVLKDPYLLRKHKLVHSRKYINDFKKFFLKKFLVLVYFLDQAKNKKLIPHDPCLFCKNASVKESKEMLIKLAREILAAVGDITKYLKYTGYVVSHVQTYIHEFDYAVNNLGVDLRDGVRLTKVMEIISMQENLTANLRVPAISRLQKIHNMKIVFNSLEKAGYQILYDISPKDIVDGHKEKTLSFLWQIVYKFQAPLMVKSATTIQTWFRSLPVVLKRRHLERIRLQRETAAKKIQIWYRHQKLARKIENYKMFLERYLLFVKQEKAVIKIQSYYRMYRCRKLYMGQRHMAINIQRFARGWLIRNIRKNQIKSAVIIQSYVRMYLKRKRYLELKRAANLIQEKYRTKKKMEAYQKLKATTINIQQRFRANRLYRIERKRYLEIRCAALCIQTWYRSITSTRICRHQFLLMKRSVIIIEQRYLAFRIMRIHRCEYQDIRRACIVIQRQYKAHTEMKIQRLAYLELKTAVISIQNIYRANRAAQKERQQFETLKSATILIQRKFRATKAMQIEYTKYNQLREAAIKIQIWFRAQKLALYHRNQYVMLMNASILIQQRWRANKLSKEERVKYEVMKKAAVIIQSRWRTNQLARKERQCYLQLKRATVVLQQKWRAKILANHNKQRYETLRKTTIFIQRKWRANKLAKKEQSLYEMLRCQVITIQRFWRANKLARIERQNYIQLKSATILIQSWWRAQKIRKQEKTQYEMLRNSTILIQQRWRANKLAKKEQSLYEILRCQVITIQRLWRANNLARIERQNYLQLKSATILIQSWWRAQRIGKQQKTQYETLRNTTILIQRRWRANILAKRERAHYLMTKSAATVVQSYWKRKQARNKYLELRETTVEIQRMWRVKKLCEQHKNYYDSLRRATVFIQRSWRANRLARIEKQKYESLKRSAIVLQTHWRTKKLVETDRKHYISLKESVLIFQRRWRARKLGKQLRNGYETLRTTVIMIQRRWRHKKVCQRHRNSYLALKAAAVTIQQQWRAEMLKRSALKRYTLLKYYTHKIQMRFRANVLMKQQRDWYLKTRISTITIQRFYRGYMSMKQHQADFCDKRKVVVHLQRFIRGYLVRTKYAYFFTQEAREERRIERMERTAAVRIQAAWRGYRSRSTDTPKLVTIRQRAKTANLNAEPQNTLGNRCRVVLQALVNEKSTVAGVNKALEDLDYITRHSRDVCQQVAQFLPEQVHLLIKTTNRSLPEMRACTLCVNILINLWKHPSTRPYTFLPGYIDNIITVMLHWSDKEAPLFPSMCTLLWLFAQTPDWKKIIKTLPNIEQRLLKIQAQVSRKQSMVRRAGVKGQSVFVSYKTLPLPSLEPDWGLAYKKNTYVFTNSIHAFSSLLNILNL